ncbi:MAG: NAD(P)-binding domain-containing protein, partial [Leeuwenhoekiella sp.]
MISISIIGTGNVAYHLAKGFYGKPDIILKQVIGRDLKSLEKFKKYTQSVSLYNTIEDVDIYIIAISDDAKEAVSNSLLTLDG